MKRIKPKPKQSKGYIQLHSGLTQHSRGDFFESYVGTEMVKRGYQVARPKPDNGDDLWIRSIEKNLGLDNSVIRCSCKAVFLVKVFKTLEKYRYSQRIRVADLERNRGRAYGIFLGLCDPENSSRFYIGFFPINWIDEFKDEFGRRGHGPQESITMHVEFSKQIGGQPAKFEMVMKSDKEDPRGWRENITENFVDWPGVLADFSTKFCKLMVEDES